MNKGSRTDIIPFNLWKHICACQFGVVARLQLWGYSHGRIRSELPGRPDNSLTASGSGITFPIGQNALQGITEHTVSQLLFPLAHDLGSYKLLLFGKRFGFWVCPTHPQLSLLERKRLIFQVLLPLPLKEGWIGRASGVTSWLWLQSLNECLI